MLEKNGNGQLWLLELLVNNVYFTMDQGDGSLTHFSIDAMDDSICLFPNFCSIVSGCLAAKLLNFPRKRS